MYQRIVVPLDGSDLAERALVAAETMAALTHAPIHLVRVIDGTADHTAAPYTAMLDPLALSASLADEIDSVRQYRGSVAQRIAARGYEVSHELRHGQVVDQLIAVSKPGDLLVMASHGRSGISRWFMGSTLPRISSAACPYPCCWPRPHPILGAGRDRDERWPAQSPVKRP